MLEIRNIPVDRINQNRKVNANFVRMKNQMDTKMASYLRYLGTKNAVNRASDYHYLCLAVTDSTAPVNGIDYIHPSVKPVVDYATAVITKGISPNGEVNFDFVPENESDSEAARQATDMVSHIINEQNDPHFVLERWVMDSAMHKNGMMMIKPVRDPITRYVETQGTTDQLQAFEQQAIDSGLTPLRQSRRRATVDMEAVMREMAQTLEQQQQATFRSELDSRIERMTQLPEEEDLDTVNTRGFEQFEGLVESQQALLSDAISRNTIYSARYKLTGYNLYIKFHPIAQHYWVCDPTVADMKDQPFCGYFDPMTIQEALELYPDINLAEFERHAEYNMNGAYQAGSVLNNLAIHARDSVPVMGIPVSSAASADPDSRQITVVTVWNRYDIDGDGELELVELIYSGSYIISAREVEFIPVANMCPKPLPGNFYGMSIAESVIPMQEYNTSAARAEIQLGLLTATPRIGVKPDRVDFEMMQDGEAAIFILDSKFDPAKDIYPMPPPAGNLQFLEVAMTRIQQDTMAMIGMTTPQDTFNPEVMAPGNSGVKLQLALTPNQIIQDNTVRNAADGLKQAIYLVWRTLIQYGDDHGVKRIAAKFHPDSRPEFMDYTRWDAMDLCDRKHIQIELALGMQSQENAIGRQQLIQKCQMDLYAQVQGMVSAGTLTESVYQKVKRPFAETLYILGVKDADTYLPSDDEVREMIAQGEQARKTREPSPADKKDLSVAELNTAKTQQIAAELQGQDPDTQLNYMAIAMGKTQDYGH
jgi:hypothetical protein